VCWFGTATPPAPGARSGYADAWYPPEHPPAPTHRDPTHDGRALPPDLPQITAPTWDAVAAALQHHRADLVVLLGMPIVPTPILDLARLGFVNAHNGALPHYRGMDAVAWALINNDAVVCTLHLVRPAVDAGEILATAPVPVTPAGTLRARVKAAQLSLLLAVTGFVTATGQLPDQTSQPSLPGRQYYRLHPHLKRVLDGSPYAPDPTAIHRKGSLP
jgi:Formyl transferase